MKRPLDIRSIAPAAFASATARPSRGAPWLRGGAALLTRVLGLALAAALLFAPSGALGASQPNCTAVQGQAFIDAGQLTQAIHEFTCVINAAPTEVDGYRGRAEALLLLGRYSDAYHDYNTGITALAVPAHPDAFTTIYDGYATRLSDDPDSVAALTGASFARWVNFDYPQAIQVLNRLLQVEPDDPYGTLFRGSVACSTARPRPRGSSSLTGRSNLRPTARTSATSSRTRTRTASRIPRVPLAEATLALNWGLDTPRVHAILAASYNAFGDVLAAAEHIQEHLEVVTSELVTTTPLVAGGSLTLDLVPGRTFAIPIMATAGETIAVSTASPDFWDSIAVLLSPGGAPVVGSDDDNAYHVAIDWEAEQTGVYVLRVTSFESVSTGELFVERS